MSLSRIVFPPSDYVQTQSDFLGLDTAVGAPVVLCAVVITTQLGSVCAVNYSASGLMSAAGGVGILRLRVNGVVPFGTARSMSSDAASQFIGVAGTMVLTGFASAPQTIVLEAESVDSSWLVWPATFPQYFGASLVVQEVRR